MLQITCNELIIDSTCQTRFPNTSTANVARGKLTAQSNVRYGGVSARAVDGRTNGYYFRGRTCTYSEGNDVTNPWWRVDLVSCYAVTRIVAYNRVDCCSNRLTDMEIRIGTILFVVD